MSSSTSSTSTAASSLDVTDDTDFSDVMLTVLTGRLRLPSCCCCVSLIKSASLPVAPRITGGDAAPSFDGDARRGDVTGVLTLASLLLSVLSVRGGSDVDDVVTSLLDGSMVR